MYQLIKNIELEPNNNKDGYVYFFDSSLEKNNINFSKLYSDGNNNKILRFNRNFDIFSSFGNIRKRGVKFFSSNDKNNEINKIIVSTASSKINYKKEVNLDEAIKDLIKYKILNYKISKNISLDIMSILRSENINENCNILDLFKIKSFSLKMIGIKDREVSDKNFLLLAEKVGNKTIIGKFLNSLIEIEFGVAEISLQESNIEKFLKHCEFKHELESTEFYKDKNYNSNPNINIESGILCIQTLGEAFEIDIKPGKYKIYEIYDEGFKNNKVKQLEAIEANKVINNFHKKYPNIDIDDYEMAMAYKDGYDPNLGAFQIETPNNHFLLLSPK